MAYARKVEGDMYESANSRVSFSLTCFTALLKGGAEAAGKFACLFVAVSSHLFRHKLVSKVKKFHNSLWDAVKI